MRNFHITGKEFERRLDEVQITVNKNAIPNDPEKPFVTSGVRVGTPAVTSRGFKEPEMVQIAHWMGQTAGTSTPAGSRSAARWMPSAASSPSTSKPGGSAVFFQHNPRLFL